MKKIFFALLLLPTLVFAQTNGFTLTGKITGIKDGEVKLTSTQDQPQTIAAGNIKDGAFTLNGMVPEPGLYYLIVGKEQPQHIYVENAAIKVSGTQKDIKNLKVEGSKSHKDFEDFKNTFNPLFNDLNLIAAAINKANDATQRADLMKKYHDAIDKLSNAVEQFIASKPNSFVSPFLLYVTSQALDNPIVMEQRFNKLAANVQNSQIGTSLKQYIEYNKVGIVGSNALELSLPDTNGQTISLSSFKGKYVLLDFWASWCKPCRMENPNVVKAYNKFNTKNFTIVGVSLDKDKQPWLDAIKSDKLTWTHISDLQFWNSVAAQTYHVNSIPQNFLIDPNGKIIARNLRGEELEAKLCEVLGCN
jgi:peroxiredoxin